MLNSTAPLPNLDLATALADELSAGRIHDPAAPSLLRAWNEGWTWRQAAKVRALVDHADPRPGETRAVPPVAYDDGCPWWVDTRPARQALRGRKSGIMRRWRTRERDELIHRWYRRGKWTVLEMAAHFGMTPQGVYYVLSRVVSAALPKLACTKRTMEYLKRWARRDTKPHPQPSPSHEPEPPREERVRGPGALVTLDKPRLVKRPA